jgi:hypothetical protein
MNLKEFTNQIDEINGRLLKIAEDSWYALLTVTTIWNPLEWGMTLWITNMDKQSLEHNAFTQQIYINNNLIN